MKIPRFQPLLPFLFLANLLSGQPLVQLADLQYKGAFRVPGDTFGGSRFGYGGTAPVFNPAKNSLFMAGFPLDNMVAEISIPTLVNSQNLNDLNPATVLQNFSEISEGMINSIGPIGDIRTGGLLLKNGLLIGSTYIYYDAGNEQISSHFTASPDFSVSGEANGLFGFTGAPTAGFVSGYMAQVPAAWQSKFGGSAITGNCCIPIISRTSFGPAAFAFEPGDLTNPANPVQAKPLVFYPQDNPLMPWDSTNLWFNGSTTIRGVVFPENSRSILFFGRHGIGPFCYGTGDDCNDPTNPYQGTHAYPYVYQIWAYDANDLAAVRQGSLQPWEPRPYARWELALPFPEENKEIGGVAYDPSTRRLFVSQMLADPAEALPVVHVFELPNYPSVPVSGFLGNRMPFSASPNPVFDEIRLSGNFSGEGVLRIGIADALGKGVFSKNFELAGGEWSEVLDLNALPAGAYFLNWELGGGLGVWRFFKIKS